MQSQSIGDTSPGPGIGERFRDDLVFVLVDDVTDPLFAEHRHVVSVGLKHHFQLLHTGDVVGSGIAEPRNASGLSPFVALRTRPVEPSRLGKILSKPRKGVAKHGMVNFGNFRSVSQPVRHLKDAQFQSGTRIAFGYDESNKAPRHRCSVRQAACR